MTQLCSAPLRPFNCGGRGIHRPSQTLPSCEAAQTGLGLGTCARLPRQLSSTVDFAQHLLSQFGDATTEAHGDSQRVDLDGPFFRTCRLGRLAGSRHLQEASDHSLNSFEVGRLTNGAESALPGFEPDLESSALFYTGVRALRIPCRHLICCGRRVSRVIAFGGKAEFQHLSRKMCSRSDY
ncbi:hypothetical protein TREES_T100006769 [Tupaia chinensis]|uniref:Uncharacterized protein n=1 Tax=Tupaia chinensis TaxID=246437 RepID=L9KIF4_TUPCH|nr:hypothetical protein TREES_T100006769 [Tupaia chinensis]